MAQDVIAHAFDPCFTTKPVDKGTGLGLSMVYWFVKQSGGHAGIESEVGYGTIVNLYLPRASDATSSTCLQCDQPSFQHGAETILVVEDDVAICELSSAILDELGYVVFVASNGEAALECCVETRQSRSCSPTSS
jgi:hypothetical protein